MSKVRKIIHVDMDCFYAAVEIRENPNLKGKPVAVGGSPEQRGVLTTCNYEARKFGLHSAMASARAVKLCPDLILIRPDFSLYKQVSAQIHEIFRRYTDIIEPLSLDEAYLDVTDCEKCSGSATWIAQSIRRTIFNELNLTASAGIAPLKFLAKIASDQNKPDGQFVIPPENVPHFIKSLPLKKIPGVGKVTAAKLSELGLEVCEDVQKSTLPFLIGQFGKMGRRIWQFSHGIDNREVQPHRERKSIGVETTLLADITALEQAYPVLDKLYVELERRIKRQNIAVETLHKLGAKLKFEDFQTTTIDKSAVEFCKETFAQLLQNIWQRCNGRRVRLLGLHVNLPEHEIKQEKAGQMSLWE